MKETKTVSGTPETRAAMHEVMAAFEAFKGANDARLAELEKKASADTLLEAKVARIDAAVGCASWTVMSRSESSRSRTQSGYTRMWTGRRIFRAGAMLGALRCHSSPSTAYGGRKLPRPFAKAVACPN